MSTNTFIIIFFTRRTWKNLVIIVKDFAVEGYALKKHLRSWFCNRGYPESMVVE